MASMRSVTLVLCAVSSLLAAAVHSAPAPPAVDCSSLVLSMADCLTFVTEGSTVKKPEATCCSGLKTVLKTDAECLCEAFRNSAQLGVKLNVTKAMTLPAACHVSAPSVSNCGLPNATTGAAPVEAPLAAPPTSVAEAPAISTAANEVSPVPAPAPAKAGASSLFAPLALLVAAAALSSTLLI